MGCTVMRSKLSDCSNITFAVHTLAFNVSVSSISGHRGSLAVFWQAPKETTQFSSEPRTRQAVDVEVDTMVHVHENRT